MWLLGPLGPLGQVDLWLKNQQSPGSIFSILPLPFQNLALCIHYMGRGGVCPNAHWNVALTIVWDVPPYLWVTLPPVPWFSIDHQSPGLVIVENLAWVDAHCIPRVTVPCGCRVRLVPSA